MRQSLLYEAVMKPPGSELTTKPVISGVIDVGLGRLCIFDFD